jgi:leader peptidase (prepilin peptidase)/N-methyltransferase
MVFIYFLITISFIDIDTKLILNKLLLYLLIFGVVTNLFLNVIQWQEALLGVVAGGLLMIIIALLGQLLFRKESLGMGDVKLAAVAGFFLGWKLIIVAVFCGFALSLPVLVALMVKGRLKLGDYIPLGPFIATAFTVFVFWGNLIINWYLKLFIKNGL